MYPSCLRRLFSRSGFFHSLSCIALSRLRTHGIIVSHTLSHKLDYQFMIQGVKAFREIHIDNLIQFILAHKHSRFADCLLHYPVANCGDSEFSYLAVTFRDFHPLHRQGVAALLPQLIYKLSYILTYTRFKVTYVLTIYPASASGRFWLLPNPAEIKCHPAEHRAILDFRLVSPYQVFFPLNSTGLPRLISQLPVSNRILNHMQHLVSIGRSHLLQGCPRFMPYQVRFRYVPLTSYCFLQSQPLPVTPLQFGLTSPDRGVVSFFQETGFAGFAGQTKGKK
jgi:hypothetical protein